MLADYHVHTSFSDDSTFLMEDVIKKAIALGLDEICFTEHVDYGVKTDLNCDYLSYKAEYLRCSEKYKNRIRLKFGIEFGMQVHTIPTFQKDFEQYGFDFVLLSCHQVGDKEFYTQKFQRGKSQQEYNEKYYQEILAVMNLYNHYSVLAHLDMIKRYDKAGEYPFEKVKDVVVEILKTAIANDKGIEINTSCYRYGIHDFTPSKEILRLYKSLGGKMITIGSDSHQKSHLGYKISQVQSELKQMGFTHFCTYDKMQPVFWKIGR